MPVAKGRIDDRGIARGWQDHTWFTTVWAGALECGDQVAPCVVRNVSLCGAKVRMALPLQIGSTAMLWSHQLGKLLCRVVWQDGEVVALRFDGRREEIRAILAAALPLSATPSLGSRFRGLEPGAPRPRPGRDRRLHGRDGWASVQRLLSPPDGPGTSRHRP